MNETRFAGRVGLFVALGIALLAGLLLIFSKGLNLFVPTYELLLRANTVGGLKNHSAVLMSGVSIGNVSGIEVAADQKGVIIRLKINRRYEIRRDARFAIEQIGFLGDQYVAIYPTKNEGPVLQPSETVSAEEPLNIEKAVRSATGLLLRVDETVKILNEVIIRVDRTVLNDQTLSNVTVALGNFRQVSERTLNMVDGVNRLVETNSRPIFLSVSNLVRFSEELDNLADEMNATVITNRVELTKAVKNLEATTRVLQRLANDIEAGKGLAGALVKDERLKTNLVQTAANLVSVSSNFNLIASNINKYGLLYKPKQPKTTNMSRPFFPGKNPFEP